jgi:hypothetical protein
MFDPSRAHFHRGNVLFQTIWPSIWGDATPYDCRGRMPDQAAQVRTGHTPSANDNGSVAAAP